MTESQTNLIVMAVCYLYISSVIYVTGYLKHRIFNPKTSRKFLHSMIGSLPLIARA
jgi:hypothetical protein